MTPVGFSLRVRALVLPGLAALAFSAPCLAQPKAPIPGAFGFDWLRPNSARCRALTETALKRLRQCEYRDSGTFGLSDPVFACRVSERSEYLIYETRAACIRNLETMKANAP